MRYRSILFLFLAILGWSAQAVGENESVFECRHVRGSELERVFRPIILHEDGVRISVDGNRVAISGGSSKLHQGLRELEPLVNVPKVSIRTKSVRVHHVDLTLAAAIVSEAFSHDSDGREMPLQAVPSQRTKQVFIFGTVKDMIAAEALLLELDRFFAQATADGCGGRSV